MINNVSGFFNDNHTINSQILPSIKRFANYTISVRFPDGRIQELNIRDVSDIEVLLKAVIEDLNSNQMVVTLCFKWGTSNQEVAMKMETFQKFPGADALEFNISKFRDCSIRIQPKPIEIQDLGDGKIRKIYSNGISEEFFLKDHYYQGTRIFPDGKKETGEFDAESREFLSGYRIEIDGTIKFIRPKSFASYKEESKKNQFEIYDVEGKLVVVDTTYICDSFGQYRSKDVITDIAVEAILLKSIQRSSYGNGISIKDALLHSSFNQNQRGFIEHILSPDESGIPRLFGLSNFGALDVIEVGSNIIDINPLKIIDPISGRNLIIQAAYWESPHLLNKLIKLFPEEFLSVGQAVIAELLRGESSTDLISDIAQQFRKLGGVVDRYHSLWIEVAKATKPDETFKEEFLLLSSDQQRTLYDSAFIYNNSFIHEAADSPITADQYSINLMWINKNKIPEHQEFLFGNESSFKEKFIYPVSKWAIRNPGSIVNIWVDSEMATSQAIERSRIALELALEGTSHGIIQFRDARSIDVVHSNPRAFSANIPIYFRVDLLRAIAADYTLREKETKFFVYGDIDMDPLSGKELFDKRTVNYLNEFGFVMAKGGALGFENGFQILNGDNPQFMDSHRKVIIDLSIEMTLERPNVIREQQIYDTYPAMVTHFFHKDGRYGKLDLLKESDNSEDSAIFLRRFRYDRFGICAHSNLPLGKKDAKLREIVPKKPVSLPPSHFSLG
jgi:hypothetical protein